MTVSNADALDTATDAVITALAALDTTAATISDTVQGVSRVEMERLLTEVRTAIGAVSDGVIAQADALADVVNDIIDTYAWEQVEITVGAEAANVIAVTIQVEGPDGTDIAAARSFWIISFEDADATLAATAALTLSPTTGTAVSTDTLPGIIATASAAGTLVLDVTDAAGASGKTFNHLVIPMSAMGRPQYFQTTFD